MSNEAERVFAEAVRLGRREGRFAEALPHARRAIALVEDAEGSNAPSLAPMLRLLVTIEVQLHEFVAAEETALRELALRRSMVGADGAEVIDSLENLAVVYQAVGDAERARAALDEALAIAGRRYPERDPRVATIHLQLGALHLNAGRIDEAAATFDAGLRLLDGARGPEHALVAGNLLGALAGARAFGGDMQEAARLYRESLGIYEIVLGPDSAQLEGVLSNLAAVEETRGHGDAAKSLRERVSRIRRSHLRPVD